MQLLKKIMTMPASPKLPLALTHKSIPGREIHENHDDEEPPGEVVALADKELNSAGGKSTGSMGSTTPKNDAAKEKKIVVDDALIEWYRKKTVLDERLIDILAQRKEGAKEAQKLKAEKSKLKGKGAKKSVVN